MENCNYGWLFVRDNSAGNQFGAEETKIGANLSFEIFVRELIQNSLDARDGKNPSVRIVVSDGEIETADYLDCLKLDELKQHISGTLSVVDGKNARASSKCNNQLDCLKESKMSFFKFSDYGTKGMDGGSRYNEEKTLWRFLVSNGETGAKIAGSGGGVGVGKNATFPFSLINTVIYTTRTEEEGYGLFGATHLLSSKINGVKYAQNGHLISYFDLQKAQEGDHSGDAVVPESALDFEKHPLIRRDECGSDVIILAKNFESIKDCPQQDKWSKYFALYTILNFYPAIKNGYFTMEINPKDGDSIVLNANNIFDTLDGIVVTEEENDDKYLRALVDRARLLDKVFNIRQEDATDDCKIVKGTHDKIGKYTLYMIRDDELCKGKTWQLFRSYGLRTISKNVSACQRNVFAVVMVDNEKGSDFLLSIETGSHTEYKPDVLTTANARSEAKNAIRTFESQISDAITDFGKSDSSLTDLELAGLTEYIYIDGIANPKTSDASSAYPRLEIGDLRPSKKNKSKKTKTRVRDSLNPDLNGDLLLSVSDTWNHGEGTKHWANHREGAADFVPASTSPSAENHGKERDYYLNFTFRDVRDLSSGEAEILGCIKNKKYANEKIDLHLFCVDEEGQENRFIPKILRATSCKDGKSLTVNGLTINDVPIDDLGFVHVQITFASALNVSLLERASRSKSSRGITEGKISSAQEDKQ